MRNQEKYEKNVEKHFMVLQAFQISYKVQKEKVNEKDCKHSGVYSGRGDQVREVHLGIHRGLAMDTFVNCGSSSQNNIVAWLLAPRTSSTVQCRLLHSLTQEPQYHV